MLYAETLNMWGRSGAVPYADRYCRMHADQEMRDDHEFVTRTTIISIYLDYVVPDVKHESTVYVELLVSSLSGMELR